MSERERVNTSCVAAWSHDAPANAEEDRAAVSDSQAKPVAHVKPGSVSVTCSPTKIRMRGVKAKRMSVGAPGRASASKASAGLVSKDPTGGVWKMGVFDTGPSGSLVQILRAASEVRTPSAGSAICDLDGTWFWAGDLVV